jgi:hypothetical protein
MDSLLQKQMRRVRKNCKKLLTMLDDGDSINI